MESMVKVNHCLLESPYGTKLSPVFPRVDRLTASDMKVVSVSLYQYTIVICRAVYRLGAEGTDQLQVHVERVAARRPMFPTRNAPGGRHFNIYADRHVVPLGKKLDGICARASPFPDPPRLLFSSRPGALFVFVFAVSFPIRFAANQGGVILYV